MPIGTGTGFVLVVEDEPLVRQIAIGEFEDHGWQVVGSPSGEQALSMLDGNPVDALFTDIQLAGSMDGWELARALRHRFPQLVVIYASGKPMDGSQRVDNSRFFTKPYAPETIVAACAELLCGSRRDARP